MISCCGIRICWSHIGDLTLSTSKFICDGEDTLENITTVSLTKGSSVLYFETPISSDDEYIHINSNIVESIVNEVIKINNEMNELALKNNINANLFTKEYITKLVNLKIKDLNVVYY